MVNSRFAVAFAVGGLAVAASVGAQVQPRYRQIYASDSLALMGPTLSPNGRWIAFTAQSPDNISTQVFVIGASGGTPVEITGRGATDVMPVWLPTSDGLVFRSSRASGGLMAIRVDAQSGQAKGDLHRVTLEPVQLGMSYAISPDGNEIAYATGQVQGHAYIRVVPAVGGTTRTITEVPVAAGALRWRSPESIEYAIRDRATDLATMRVASHGGTPQVVRHYDLTKGFVIDGGPFALRGAVVRINADTLGRVSVVSPGGDTVAHIDTRGSQSRGGLYQLLRIADDGSTVMMAAAHSRTAVRLASISGEGTPRTLRPISDTSSIDEAVGFSADSRGVYSLNRHLPVPRLELIPVGGGQSRFWTLPSDVRGVYATSGGQFAYVAEGHSGANHRTLHLLNLQTGKLEEVSNRVSGRRIYPNPDRNDILFAEANGTRFDFRRFIPGQGNTVIASVDTSHLNYPNRAGTTFNEHGVVYHRVVGDSSLIFGQRGDVAHLITRFAGSVYALALSPDGHTLAVEGKRKEGGKSRSFAQLVSLDDELAPRTPPMDILGTAVGFDEVTWSPDGKTLGVGYSAQVRSDTVLTWSFLTPDGKIQRTVQIPRPFAFSEWSTFWGKDGKHVYVLTTNDPETKMDVWRISSTGNERPQSILSREANQVWDFWLSPDEKNIVYNPDLPAHSAIWRVDLPGLAVAKP